MHITYFHFLLLPHSFTLFLEASPSEFYSSSFLLAALVHIPATGCSFCTSYQGPWWLHALLSEFLPSANSQLNRKNSHDFSRNICNVFNNLKDSGPFTQQTWDKICTGFVSSADVLHFNITISRWNYTLHMLWNILQIPTLKVHSVIPALQLQEQIRSLLKNFRKICQGLFMHTPDGYFHGVGTFSFSCNRGTIYWKIYSPVLLDWLSRFFLW
jgi:hypothetical protein